MSAERKQGCWSRNKQQTNKQHPVQSDNPVLMLNLLSKLNLHSKKCLRKEGLRSGHFMILWTDMCRNTGVGVITFHIMLLHVDYILWKKINLMGTMSSSYRDCWCPATTCSEKSTMKVLNNEKTVCEQMVEYQHWTLQRRFLQHNADSQNDITHSKMNSLVLCFLCFFVWLS